MDNRVWRGASQEGMTRAEIGDMVESLVREMQTEKEIKRVLLLPPDYTRVYSDAGLVTALFYKKFETFCQAVDVLPAVGTHDPMTEEEIRTMFYGAVPASKVLYHNWKKDVEEIGVISGQVMKELSGGITDEPLTVEVDRRLLDPAYDAVISIGQVIPHEVVGMANYGKNIFVGCGGGQMINRSHILGAFCGIETILGQVDTPPRSLFDYAQEHFLGAVPLLYVLTVSGQRGGKDRIQSIFTGTDREVFEKAAQLSRKENITYLEKPAKKIVAYMDEDKYKSTWLSNKAVYRSRKAMATGGELVVVAPGVKKFGEDMENDSLIRSVGYRNSSEIKELCREGGPLTKALSVGAHLMHGTADGRFQITYAPGHLSKEEIESVSYSYLPLEKAGELYGPFDKETGYYRTAFGEEYYFIRHPAAGLWMAKE